MTDEYKKIETWVIENIDYDKLTDSINGFLEECAVKLIDIKFSVVVDSADNLVYTALIIYEATQ